MHCGYDATAGYGKAYTFRLVARGPDDATEQIASWLAAPGDDVNLARRDPVHRCRPGPPRTPARRRDPRPQLRRPLIRPGRHPRWPARPDRGGAARAGRWWWAGPAGCAGGAARTRLLVVVRRSADARRDVQWAVAGSGVSARARPDRRRPKSVKINRASQTRAKPASRAGGIGSWKISTPQPSWRIGATYWSMPSAVSGSRLAAPAKSSSGIAVAAPAEHQQRGVPGRDLPERRAAPARQPAQVGQGGQRQHRRLDEQPLGRRQSEPLLGQSVAGEADRQGQRQVGQPTVVDGEHRDRAPRRPRAPPTAPGAAARAARTPRAAPTPAG